MQVASTGISTLKLAVRVLPIGSCEQSLTARLGDGIECDLLPCEWKERP
jgi:hypothetical protein